MTGLPGGAGNNSRPESALQQGISLSWSCSLDGLSFKGIKYFCWGVLHFFLGMDILVLTGYTGLSLVSFLTLLVGLSYPVFGPGFPC